MSKAIIGTESTVAIRERLLETARRADSGERLPEADYHLNFADETQLFSEITPQRWHLLTVLQSRQRSSIRTLADQLERPYNTVAQDVQRLIELGLIEETARGIKVPFEAIELRLSTAPSKTRTLAA
jgi:predicted transcriptional regulator